MSTLSYSIVGPLVNSRNPFESPGVWLKGNLHTHSTQSDGLRDPDDVVRWYTDHGYDFLAITDHRTRTIVDPPEDCSLIMLPSMELNGWDESFDGEYHLTGIGLASLDHTESGTSLQAAVDQVKADGGLAILAHPHWLGVAPHRLFPISGLDGLEVFNVNCEVANGKGDSGHLWDHALDAGMTLHGLAVDDAHWHGPDAGEAWVMARSEMRTAAAICDALAAGCFYSTQGPEIHSFTVDGNVASARCSPVADIRFVSQRNFGSRVKAENGEIEEAEFILHGQEKYVRLVCIDREGRMAWSNPVMTAG